MNLERLDELRTIDPRLLLPWRTEPFTEVEIGPDRETARERAETIRSTSEIVAYLGCLWSTGPLGCRRRSTRRPPRGRRVPTGPGWTEDSGWIAGRRLRNQCLVDGRTADIVRHGKRSRGTMTMAKMIVVTTGLAKRSRCRQFNFAFSASPEAF